MPLERLPAVFMRGGTSKAVVFRQEHLPPERAKWDPIFLEVMGSPDVNGRQLDGMGGGISSLSKVCVVGPSSRSDADIDYTFAQVSVDSPTVDYSGNCGNMLSAMGPFAVDEGLVAAPENGEAVVRIHNTNTQKVIHARFEMKDGAAAVDGDMAIAGVAGAGAAVKLEFRDPGGSKTKKLLPTGNPVDVLEIDGLGKVEASLVDAANPCVFVEARILSKTGRELPDELEADPVFLKRMEAIRCAASVAMGIGADMNEAAAIPSVPKVAIVAAPDDMPTLSGETIAAADMDIAVRMISIGRPHRAVPMTGAVCLGVAARIPGSLPNRIADPGPDSIRIAHPSGIVVVDAKVDGANGASLKAEYGAVYRTARRLFEGAVCYRPRA
jgi:2-methylaconitate cis-trans-isomerase PrpF